MVMWRSTTPKDAQALFDQWMVAYTSDTSGDAQRVRVLRAKPKPGVDGCYDRATPPAFLADNLVFSSKPVSPCSTLYPVYSNTRKEAGGPLAGDILKCQLTPVDSHAYKVAFTSDQVARLQRIFPAGVCDWSKGGVSEGPVKTWASFGPFQENMIFDVSRP
jgi:hypothetical protein